MIRQPFDVLEQQYRHLNAHFPKDLRQGTFLVSGTTLTTALESYLRVAADLQAGRRDQFLSIPDDAVTVKDECNHFLTYQLQKVEAAEISTRWFEDFRWANPPVADR